ncbi:MAG TPA: DUF2252 domain-containing protein, partial [Candidatus Binatia bacterium]|nr:DUF2252 domain-containing protein [Candidatus Binatia bacterium]
QHGAFALSTTRQDPVAILEAQARTRLPELVPIRYARMLTSPFAFLRGAAAVMAHDFATTATTGLMVQACGDMHVANFGVFASAERNLIFGINDFDETHPGPWEWDVKRLVASAAVAARFFGADRVLCEEAARACVQAYRKRMQQYARMGHLALWYTSIDEPAVLEALPPEVRKRAGQVMSKARQRTHLQVLDKLTDLVDAEQRIVEARPLIVHETHTRPGRTMTEALELFLQDYLASLPPDRRQLLARYQMLDVARKVVGVGSVGTRCWVIFMRGVDNNDPLFLQVKEAQESVLTPYVGPSAYANHGHRVVVGQRLIQGAPDIFLGWAEQDGTHYYVRQLRDMKGGLEFDPTRVRVANFPAYCILCGWALALAHAKSGDAALIAGYVGTSAALDESMARFALAYADQTERDHEALTRAARHGRIRVAGEE